MLLNEANLDAAEFAAKTDMRKVLNCMYCTKDKTVATDSYRLLEVETPKYDEKYSLPTGWKGSEESFLVSRGDVKSLVLPLRAAAKDNPIPLLRNLDASKVSDEDIQVSIGLAMQTKAKIVDGMYPDYEQIMPSGPHAVVVSVSADYLYDLARYMKKHAENGRVSICVEASEKPVLFVAKTEEGQKIRGLVMPLRRMDEDPEARKNEPVIAKPKPKKAEPTKAKVGVKAEDLPM